MENLKTNKGDVELLTKNKKNLPVGVFGSDYSTPNMNQRLYLAMRMKGFEKVSEFASFCGFSRSFMSKIIHRKIKPSIDDAEKIAFKLDLRLKDIFESSDLRIPGLNFLNKKEEKSK